MSNKDSLGINIDVNTIAICMAVYNGEKCLPAQLDSILNQTFKNWILFVRDDGSTDLSGQILKDYCEKYPQRIINVKDKKGNSGGARQNFARILKYAKKIAEFQYYMFSDQDDVWLPE